MPQGTKLRRSPQAPQPGREATGRRWGFEAGRERPAASPFLAGAQRPARQPAAAAARGGPAAPATRRACQRAGVCAPLAAGRKGKREALRGGGPA